MFALESIQGALVSMLIILSLVAKNTYTNATLMILMIEHPLKNTFTFFEFLY